MDKNYDFSGWATRNDLVCSDGRTIRRDAFKDCDGKTVPLVWNHQHNDPSNVLGHALLENRKDGVYAYCSFNDSEYGQIGKMLVKHGDVESLSIYANHLKQDGGNVMHGDIKEVSLVVAGANPGAFIDFVDMAHSEGSEQEVIICPDVPIYFAHADKEDDDNDEDDTDEDDDNETVQEVFDTLSEKQKNAVYAIIGAILEDSDQKPDTDKGKKLEHADKDDDELNGDETVQDVFNSLTEKQKTVVYAIIGSILEDNDVNIDSEDNDKTPDSKGGNKTMKHNVFDIPEDTENVLSHADQNEIITSAKMKSVGSLQNAVKLYCEEHGDVLQHGYEDLESLFPDVKDVRPGAPELITRDQGWVSAVMNKCHKTPFSRIRTKQVDARVDEVRGHGFNSSKNKAKKELGNIKLVKRTTDPQTVYVKDKINRDDIIDITDFDFVQYQYGVMRQLLNEEVAMAIMVGDGRDDTAEDKISEEHIRSIWKDDDLYTIHQDIDMEAVKTELQGSGTDANFGENYIRAEAFITAALYAREDYKGTGTPDLYCTPHMLNVMLLARDRNGRRIYESKADIASALNVGNIYTVEQFEKLERKEKDHDENKHKLLGLFVNMSDYTIGSTKGGEITRFNQFDIDFNAEKYLIETRLSGALTRVKSAIALEEKVNP